MTTTVSATKADTQQDTTSSVTSTQWLGTGPILANIQSKQVTEKEDLSSIDHHHSSGRHNYSTMKQNNIQDNVSAHQRDTSANKVEPHSVRLDNSTTNKYDSKIDNRCNKQYNHQRSSSSTRQDNSSEKQKSASTKKSRAGDIPDTNVNQNSSSVTSNRVITTYGENTAEHVSRKSSQRNSSSSYDQQELRYVKQSSNKDVGRRISNSDYSDDTFSQQETGGSYRRERHDSNSSSSRHQQERQQIRRHRHSSSSSSRQPDGRRDRDGNSSDRQSDTRCDGSYSSSRWDRQQSNEVVKQLTSHQQYALGDKGRFVSTLAACD